MDYRIDYTTSFGNGGYFVVSTPDKTRARQVARQQVVLNRGEKIRSLRVGNGTFYF